MATVPRAAARGLSSEAAAPSTKASNSARIGGAHSLAPDGHPVAVAGLDSTIGPEPLACVETVVHLAPAWLGARCGVQVPASVAVVPVQTFSTYVFSSRVICSMNPVTISRTTISPNRAVATTPALPALTFERTPTTVPPLAARHRGADGPADDAGRPRRRAARRLRAEAQLLRPRRRHRAARRRAAAALRAPRGAGGGAHRRARQGLLRRRQHPDARRRSTTTTR